MQLDFDDPYHRTYCDSGWRLPVLKCRQRSAVRVVEDTIGLVIMFWRALCGNVVFLDHNSLISDCSLKLPIVRGSVNLLPHTPLQTREVVS